VGLRASTPAEPQVSVPAILRLAAPGLAEVLPRSLGPYLALTFIGFVVGVAGHIVRSRWLVAIGVMLIFLGTLLFPLALNVIEDDRPFIPERHPE
jgi:hypothetical protein